jgi:hypothetical protein
MRRRLARLRLELRHRFYAGAVARDLNFTSDMTDRGLDALEDRIAALEEVIAARWPRSAVLRRQLRRELRSVDAQYAGAEATFRRRRQQWQGDVIIIASLKAARRGPGKR